MTLTVGDCTLHREDVCLLDRGCWMNDALLCFSAEHDAPLRGAAVSFLPPATMVLLKEVAAVADGDALGRVLGSDAGAGGLYRRLVSSRAILAPVSDAGGRGGGGSHWSLLVLVRTAAPPYPARFSPLLFDSMQTDDHTAAAALAADAILRALGCGAPGGLFVPARVPQQTNTSDCGAFVSAFMHAISTAVHNADGSRDIADVVVDAVRSLQSPSTGAEERKRLLAVYNTLTKNKK